MVHRRKRRSDELTLAIEFISNAQAAADLATLTELIACACRDMGFEYFALVHHGDLKHPAPGIIRIDNYPERWSRLFVERHLYATDPVHEASLHTNIGFLWSRVPGMIRLTRLQRDIFAQSASAGLRFGFTVPAHVPGERAGSCSFAASCDEPSRFTPITAQIVGAAAFEAARRMVPSRAAGIARDLRLSPRQRECLALIAQGKTDWETARIIGLSEETVTKYINAARARYGVSRRIQLALEAIFDGQISFSEVLFRQ